MADIRTAHTAQLDDATLAAARALVEQAFAGEFDAHDWEHALGGMHALAFADGELVGHASVVQRRHQRCAEAAAAVIGATLMAALDPVLRGGYELGALGATDAAQRLYAAAGWQPWRGPLSALTPAGIVRTPDADGAVYVLALGVALDLDAELTCDWRDGDVW